MLFTAIRITIRSGNPQILAQAVKRISASRLLHLLIPLAFWLSGGGAHGQSLTVLRNLAVSDGYTPYGTLVLSGNVLYGTSLNGGTAAKGTVFKINTDGTGYTLLKSFDSAGPNSPVGKLLLSGATLYGTTLTDGTDAASLTRIASSTCRRVKSKFCYETRQLVSLILSSFLWAW